MNRRTYVLAAGSGATALLAGCLGDSDDDGGDDTDGTGNGDAGENDGHGAVDAVEAYADAAADKDIDAMAAAMHPAHPFNPDNIDDEGDDERTFDVDEFDSYDAELEDETFDTDNIRDLPEIEFWFEDDELDDYLDGEDAALVSLEIEYTEDGDQVTETDQLITLTDDGEWGVFFVYEEPSEIPDDDPIDDDAYRIVDELVFDEEMETVTIELIDSIEADIDEVVAYSESLERDNSVWQEESTDGFPITSFTSTFDPEGDTIVVTAIEDDEEIVVHREEYEP